MIAIEDSDLIVIQGDAREEARNIPQDSIDVIVTSPPYFRLRDYGVEGQIGLEESISVYIEQLRLVFNRLRGALRDSGSLWIVIDDSYAGGGNYRGVSSEDTLTDKQRSNGGARGVSQALGGIKDLPAKNLCLIPHRLALNLQADGWYVRQEVIWRKTNPMVESAKDRCTRSHEYVFHLTKKPTYFWSWDEAQEPAEWERWGKQTSHKGYWPTETSPTKVYDSRNMRNVWDFTTANEPDAHFAVFPPALVSRMLLLTCPPEGNVLDPFMGSGTVAVVARKMGLKCVGIELNPEYIDLIRTNTGQQSLLA